MVRFKKVPAFAGAFLFVAPKERNHELLIKTHGYHWNVEGPHFRQLHIQFMEQYTEMWTAVDELAERIRALGHLLANRSSRKIATSVDTGSFS